MLYDYASAQVNYIKLFKPNLFWLVAGAVIEINLSDLHCISAGISSHIQPDGHVRAGGVCAGQT